LHPFLYSSVNTTVLAMTGITKRFGNLVANDDISIVLQKGEVLALLGENGAGKSTLMSILFGHYIADEGIVEVHGKRLAAGDTQAAIKAGVGMVHQHFALAENLTVLDNVLIGRDSLFSPRLSSRTMREKLLSTAQEYGLEVNPDALVGSLSMGGRQRVEILKALVAGKSVSDDSRSSILILDEPTAILTPQESESLFKTLAGFVTKGLSIVFISHKLNEVLRVSDKISVLRGGRLVAQRETQHTNSAELAELMVGKSVAMYEGQKDESAEAVTLKGRARHTTLADQALTLDVQALSGQLVKSVSLKVRSGEIFGIAGVSGNGQTELANLLCGVAKPQSGNAFLMGQTYPLGANSANAAIHAGVARIPEDRTQRGVIGDASLTENICIGRHRSPSLFATAFNKFLSVFNHKKRHAAATAIANQFDIRHNGLNKSTRQLSGGNIQKLVLGRELGLAPEKIRLVIANQPTWGLDVGAIAYVHSQLRQSCERGSAVVLISDELDEILALSDTISVMFKGELGPARPAHEWTRTGIGLAMAGSADAGGQHAA
jgi:general nucleoside transport system ATP-binding protein